MKLVLAIVQDEDANALSESLLAESFSLTRINTAGGFLREGNVSFLLGVDELVPLVFVGVARRALLTQLTNPISMLRSCTMGPHRLTLLIFSGSRPQCWACTVKTMNVLMRRFH